MTDDIVTSSLFCLEDLYIIPGIKPQDDTLVVIVGSQTLLFKNVSNAQRSFWHNMNERTTNYFLTYSQQTWTLKCYDQDLLVGLWERKLNHDSWKEYPLELEPKETT